MCVLEDGHVTTIAVDPRWHRYKLGTRLLLALARGGIDEGAQNLTHEVRASNRGAQALYHRFGFVPAGIRKGYYIETNEDAIVMWANDADPTEDAQCPAPLESSLPGATTHGARAGRRYSTGT